MAARPVGDTSSDYEAGPASEESRAGREGVVAHAPRSGLTGEVERAEVLRLAEEVRSASARGELPAAGQVGKLADGFQLVLADLAPSWRLGASSLSPKEEAELQSFGVTVLPSAGDLREYLTSRVERIRGWVVEEIGLKVPVPVVIVHGPALAAVSELAQRGELALILEQLRLSELWLSSPEENSLLRVRSSPGVAERFQVFSPWGTSVFAGEDRQLLDAISHLWEPSLVSFAQEQGKSLTDVVRGEDREKVEAELGRALGRMNLCADSATTAWLPRAQPDPDYPLEKVMGAVDWFRQHRWLVRGEGTSDQGVMRHTEFNSRWVGLSAPWDSKPGEVAPVFREMFRWLEVEQNLRWDPEQRAWVEDPQAAERPIDLERLPHWGSGGRWSRQLEEDLRRVAAGQAPSPTFSKAWEGLPQAEQILFFGRAHAALFRVADHREAAEQLRQSLGERFEGAFRGALERDFSLLDAAVEQVSEGSPWTTFVQEILKRHLEESAPAQQLLQPRLRSELVANALCRGLAKKGRFSPEELKAIGDAFGRDLHAWGGRGLLTATRLLEELESRCPNYGWTTEANGLRHFRSKENLECENPPHPEWAHLIPLFTALVPEASPPEDALPDALRERFAPSALKGLALIGTEEARARLELEEERPRGMGA